MSCPVWVSERPEDKNHLLIDEETAPIVRLIFGYALNGHGPNHIRRRLEEEKSLAPHGGTGNGGFAIPEPNGKERPGKRAVYVDFSVIKDLLMNPVYTGAISFPEKTTVSKSALIGEKKPEDWIVVEGQHEPLIDRMSFGYCAEQAEIPPASGADQ